MKPLLILYATREGQTRHIAEHIEAKVRDHGYAARLENVKALHEPFDLDGYAGAILAAPVHAGKHPPEMVDFVKRHRDKLEELPGAFLSVSLTEAGAEDVTRAEDDRKKAAADVSDAIDRFLSQTGWRPQHVEAVAGALRYSKYNFVMRFIMKRIARKGSLSTDTSRDHEFTNWRAVDRIVDDLLGEHIVPAATREAPAPA